MLSANQKLINFKDALVLSDTDDDDHSSRINSIFRNDRTRDVSLTDTINKHNSRNLSKKENMNIKSNRSSSMVNRKKNNQADKKRVNSYKIIENFIEISFETRTDNNSKKKQNVKKFNFENKIDLITKSKCNEKQSSLLIDIEKADEESDVNNNRLVELSENHEIIVIETREEMKKIETLENKIDSQVNNQHTICNNNDNINKCNDEKDIVYLSTKLPKIEFDYKFIDKDVRIENDIDKLK